MTRRFAVAAVLLLAGGCATLPPPGDAGDWPARRETLQALERWSLDGRIAVAAGDEGFTGGFDWVQAGERADIFLSGPVGGAAVQIRIEGGEAVVVTGRPGEDAEDAAALLKRYIGSQHELPVAQMRYWLVGAPAPRAPAEETLGPDRRLVSLTQSGWMVQFHRYEAVGSFELPARLEMFTEGLRLRVVVSDWELPP